MADLTPCENSLLGNLRLYKENIVFVPTASILEGVDYCRTLAKPSQPIKSCGFQHSGCGHTIRGLKQVMQIKQKQKIFLTRLGLSPPFRVVQSVYHLPLWVREWSKFTLLYQILAVRKHNSFENYIFHSKFSLSFLI